MKIEPFGGFFIAPAGTVENHSFATFQAIICNIWGPCESLFNDSFTIPVNTTLGKLTTRIQQFIF